MVHSSWYRRWATKMFLMIRRQEKFECDTGRSTTLRFLFCTLRVSWFGDVQIHTTRSLPWFVKELIHRFRDKQLFTESRNHLEEHPSAGSELLQDSLLDVVLVADTRHNVQHHHSRSFVEV